MGHMVLTKAVFFIPCTGLEAGISVYYALVCMVIEGIATHLIVEHRLKNVIHTRQHTFVCLNYSLYILTYHCKLIGVLKISNAIDSPISIVCHHHLTRRAVGVAWTDAFRERFAYGKVDETTSDVGLGIASRNDTIGRLNSQAPVISSVPKYTCE